MDGGGFFVLIVHVAAGASFGAAGLPKKENTGFFFLAVSWGSGGDRRGRHGGGLGHGRRALTVGLTSTLALGATAFPLAVEVVFSRASSAAFCNGNHLHIP